MAVRRTGYKVYTMLRQKDLNTGEYTGLTKPNSESDPDYIPPVYDPATCPVEQPEELSVNPSSYDAHFEFNAFLISISSNTTYTISTNVPWIITPDAGEGNFTVQVSVMRNTGPQRDGVITIATANKTVTVSVTQESGII